MYRLEIKHTVARRMAKPRRFKVQTVKKTFAVHNKAGIRIIGHARFAIDRIDASKVYFSHRKICAVRLDPLENVNNNI